MPSRDKVLQYLSPPTISYCSRALVSKGRIDQCLRNGNVTLNAKARCVHSKRTSKKHCVNGVTGQLMRLKYGREHAKFALKKREAQAKQYMSTAIHYHLLGFLNLREGLITHT